MAITLYGIPNCDTVKKARAHLNERGIEHHFHDFKKLGVAGGTLSRWVDAVGWERVLNRQGTTWRKLDAAVQASVADAESAQRVMQEHVSVIKRPVVEWGDGRITVGFDPKTWP